MLAETTGLEGLSINALVDTAGVSKGTFFHHFGDRTSYLVALHRRFHDGILAEVQHAVAGMRPGRDRLATMSTTYLDACLRQRGVRALILEARGQLPIQDEIIRRNSSNVDFMAIDFVTMEWPRPRSAARLWIAANAECALIELDARRADPEARAACWISSGARSATRERLPGRRRTHPAGSIDAVLHTYRFGPTGPARILAIHGLTGYGGRWETLFREHLPDVAVVAPDLLGHGRSSWDAPWTIEANVAALAALVEAEGAAPVVAVGHSFGAAIALSLAATRPDLVAGLVLLDPAVALDGRRMREIADSMYDSPDYTDRDEARAEKANGSWGDVPAAELERELDEHLVDTAQRPRGVADQHPRDDVLLE